MTKGIRRLFESEDPEKINYDPLLQGSDNDSCSNGEDNSPHNAMRSRIDHIKSALRVTAGALLVCLALWGVANIGRRTFNISIAASGQRSCSCGGTTVAEAISRGCIFTPLAIAWLPPHCIDMELANQFDRAGPDGGWEYWADPNATIPMTRYEVSMLADTEGAVFYTTQDWHVTHCVYTWMKHYRSKSTGVTIENRSNGIEHIKHCEGILRNDHRLEEIFTKAGIELNADLV